MLPALSSKHYLQPIMVLRGFIEGAEKTWPTGSIQGRGGNAALKCDRLGRVHESVLLWMA